LGYNLRVRGSWGWRISAKEGERERSRERERAGSWEVAER